MYDMDNIENMGLIRPSLTKAARDRLERRTYPRKAKAGPKAKAPEGMELDIAMEKMRDSETSRGWAIRQARSLHSDMHR